MARAERRIVETGDDAKQKPIETHLQGSQYLKIKKFCTHSTERTESTGKCELQLFIAAFHCDPNNRYKQLA